ncbi:MAG TPA: C25 family cysteine peptidase [Bacteroidota bacterium]|nr:C25 family cysteine peptidase [Bacteroidota bacterium]
MRKTAWLPVMILLTICVRSDFLFSAAQNVKKYSWGSLQVSAPSSGSARLKLSLDPQGIEKGTAVISQRVLFYALSPSERLTTTVASFTAAPILLRNIYRPLRTPSTRDTTTVAESLEQIPLNELPQAPNVRVAGYGWYRGFYLARIEVTPFYGNPSTHVPSFAQSIDVQVNKTGTNAVVPRQLPKIRDPHFDRILRELVVNYDDAAQYQMPLVSDTTGGWFNTTSTYVKLTVPNDGIYRITQTRLDSILPAIAGADPRTFQVFDRGKEIPIYVAGDSDGVFNPGDYIEFPALRNYTGKHRIITSGVSQEYNEYLNRYTDSTILWLTWGIKPGLRMPANPSRAATPDTLTAYTAFIHMEVQGPTPGLQMAATDNYSSQDYRWNSFDLWPWNFLGGSQTTTKTFTASNPAFDGDSVTVYAKIASWGANLTTAAHKIAIRLNKGVDLNTVTLNLGGEAVLSGKTRIDSLKFGTNSVILYSYPTAATTNSIVYDWFEIEYPRTLKVVGDTLLFDFRTLPDRHFRNVKITGLQSPNFILYRIRPSNERISNFTISASSPYTVTFCDTIGPQEQFVIMPQAKVYTPVFTAVKTFAGLRSNTSQTDYLAITHSKFYPEAVQYVQSVSASKHLSARLFNVQDIFDEFGYGYPTAEAVQAFVRSSAQWSSPLPSYLTLLGDASYDYKYYYANYNAINYVPSVGYPVSDVAYALFDTVSNLPQMYVGRLPLNNVGDLTQYLSFYNSVISTPNDDWNKHYLLFTGGDPTVSGQIDLLKSINDEVANTLITPPPIGGIATHFYKTITPQSDFGPYTSQQVKDAISTGGVFISYIGHSGTQTWDNSIGDPLQLKNSRGRYPLITDMGCSTGKFAEPQIQSFSELFIVGPEASAIGYIGNSSLGYESIATSLPPIFYSAMLKDSIVRVGETHLTAKLRQIAQQGLSPVNSIMLYNNTLIGDPTVDLPVPFLPNLAIQENLISSTSVFTDDQDSAEVTIVYSNLGSVTTDSVDVRIQHLYHSQVIQSWLVRRPMPLVYDTLTVYIVINQEADEHDVVVTLDPSNKITESIKTDNSATKAFFVSSTDFKVVQPQPTSVAAISSLILLNPTTQRYDPTKIVTVEVDTLGDYSSPTKPLTLNVPMGVVSTSFPLGSLKGSTRYYWRAKFQSNSGNWSTGTFYQGTDPTKGLGQIDSVGWQGNAFTHVQFFPGTGSKIQNTSIVLQAISGGFLDGNFGAVEFNGVNKLPSTLARGHSIVVIDPTADTVINQRTYDLYGTAAYADSIAQFVNSAAPGAIVVAVIINDGWTHITAAVLNAYHGIGSRLIDSVKFRDSWAIIGRKGAAPGSVQESWKPSTTGKAILDTTIVQVAAAGTIVTPPFGPVSGWNQLSVDRTVPSGAHATVTMLGLQNNGNVDTLFSSYDSSTVNLQKISAARYPNARLIFNLSSNSSLNSPVITDWNVKAQLPPELVLTQNTVSLDKSTMQEGEIINVGATTYNVGSSPADSVLISILTDDSGPLRTLKSMVIPVINAQDSVHVQTQYDSRGKRGSHSFTFQVDPNNAIVEYYKSNNTAVAPYSIVPDTLSPSVDVTIDNIHVANGDFVRAAPVIVFQVNDPNGSPITQNDTSNVYIELDGNQVYYSGNNAVQFTAGSAPLIAQVRWTPQLAEGQHSIVYYAKDEAGNFSDTTLLSINVTNTLQLSEVYNIPNPFPNGTTFTFVLAGTDNPQSVHIKIYTVAGRLIQDLDFSSKVHVGINGYQSAGDNLYWNGRDRDGDEIANGVYFYRVIINGGGQQAAATQKLVKIR